MAIIFFDFFNLGCCVMPAKYGTSNPKLFALSSDYGS
ncbi:uncharacterized protein G2W53_043265 [Senna tora]|uniref:Uncharacterized protein n=1 Tax=Senna tora TaxID=362788 RepID=A0A834W4T1_9FABA|nr:uncharacterized protein G2W53_043265 [Senna tora]